MSYRAFAVRDDKYYRAPFDDILGTNADTPLPSGCNSPKYDLTFPIFNPATTCDEGVCVSMEFMQGDKFGPHEGFPAKSVLNLLDGENGFQPLVVR